MTVGTLFTLFVVPSLYVLIAREHREQAPEVVEGDPLTVTAA